MYRNDHATATAEGLFTEGTPNGGVPPTIVPAAWMNDAVQEELVNLVEGAGLTLAKANNAQVKEAVQILSSGSHAFSNELINGGFDVFQRDNSEVIFAGTPEYVLDRWLIDAGGGSGQATVTRLLHTLGQTDVIGNPRGLMRFDQTVGATTTNPKIQQRVESVENFSADTVTFDIWARVVTGTLSVTPRLTQNFGPGGSASIDIDKAVMSLTTTWQRFSRTFDLASVSGKTINAGSFLGLKLLLPTGATFTVEVSQAQLTKTAVAPVFVRRPRQIEEALCYRYYQKSYPQSTFNNPTAFREGQISSWDVGVVAWGLAQRFRVEMRATPTVVWYSPEDAGAGKIRWDGAGVAVSSQLYDSTAGVGAPTVGSAQAESRVSAHWEADAEL